jgi:hypothetical protein
MSGITPQQKKDPEKKSGVRIDKKRRWNLIWKAPCFKEQKERGWDLQATRRDSIERKKGDHIFL